LHEPTIGLAMHHEVINEQRNAEGGLEVQRLYLLTDAEVEQHKRAGLARHGLENTLSEVHHVLSPSRGSVRGQHIITNAEGARLHASGEWLPPDINPDDPRLWRWIESGAELSEWVREGGLIVPGFAFAPTSGEREMEYLDPQWQRETLVRDPQIEIAKVGEWKAELLDANLTRGEPIQEVQRTTLNLQVGAGADDVYANNVSTFSDTGTFILFGLSDTIFDIACRFTSVTIPVGATIDTATSTFVSFNNASGTTVNTNIYCEDADDPAQITSHADFHGRTMTTAFTAWDSIAAWTGGTGYSTSDFTSAVQEYSDRAGRASGNAIQVFIKDDGSDVNALRWPATYEHASYTAPQLDIDYTVPPPKGAASSMAASGGLAGAGGLAGKGGGLAA
jgi:hypothetical protein